MINSNVESFETKFTIDTTGAIMQTNNTNTGPRTVVGGYINTSNLNPNLAYYVYNSSNSVTDIVQLYFDGSDFYIAGKKGGADTVSKKLSSGFTPYTLKNMTLGAYYSEDLGTNVATSNIYISTIGASSITLTMSKNHYCSWSIKNPSDTNLKSTTARGATTNTYTLDVSTYDYIRITATPNGSGYANLNVQNISLS